MVGCSVFEACLGGLLYHLVRDAAIVLHESFCVVSILGSVIFVGFETGGFLSILRKVSRGVTIGKIAQSFDRA